MRFLEVLPLVFVMVAGPQILSAIFLATSDDWRRNSAAFVAGAAISISLVVTIAYGLSAGVTDQGESNTTLSAIVLVALVLAMGHTYRTRETSEPPRWMGALQTATPRFSFRLGFLLMGFFPTDIFTSVAVGSYLAARGASLLEAIPFILCTLLVLAIPSLTLVAFSERAETVLPTVRNWMDANSWIVNELVLLFFIAMTLNNLLG
ncbi:GAP family protein [Natrinema sp. HArc-T2]|uniref:GAP family protein n=1 Tax=Natrinema sp. HArc-T2 TaxID=3242701 RepID=UPI00359E1DCB